TLASSTIGECRLGSSRPRLPDICRYRQVARRMSRAAATSESPREVQAAPAEAPRARPFLDLRALPPQRVADVDSVFLDDREAEPRLDQQVIHLVGPERDVAVTNLSLQERVVGASTHRDSSLVDDAAHRSSGALAPRLNHGLIRIRCR